MFDLCFSSSPPPFRQQAQGLLHPPLMIKLSHTTTITRGKPACYNPYMVANHTVGGECYGVSSVNVPLLPVWSMQVRQYFWFPAIRVRGVDGEMTLNSLPRLQHSYSDYELGKIGTMPACPALIVFVLHYFFPS